MSDRIIRNGIHSFMHSNNKTKLVLSTHWFSHHNAFRKRLQTRFSVSLHVFTITLSASSSWHESSKTVNNNELFSTDENFNDFLSKFLLVKSGICIRCIYCYILCIQLYEILMF